MKDQITSLRKITAVLLTAAAVFSSACASLKDEPVQKVLDAKIQAGAVPCGVFIYTDPERNVVVAESGWQNAEKTVPADENSLFWCASMTKGVTGIAFMMLVDEGKVSLDTPVCDILPEFAGHPDVKMKHLMSHTSGLDFSGSKWGELSLSDYSKKIAAKKARYKVGSKYEYGDGPCIAGRVIEVLSGMPYETFLQKRIFNPLDMNDTSFNPTAEQRKRLVSLVRWDDKEKKFIPWGWDKVFGRDVSEYRYPVPSAGLFSSASDYVKMVRMLLCKGLAPDGTRLLSEKSVAELGTAHVPEATEYGVGFGGNQDCFWHAGAAGTTWWIRPATHRGYIWMTNVIGMYGGIAETREACIKAAEVYDPQEELRAWKEKYHVK